MKSENYGKKKSIPVKKGQSDGILTPKRGKRVPTQKPPELPPKVNLQVKLVSGEKREKCERFSDVLPKRASKSLSFSCNGKKIWNNGDSNKMGNSDLVIYRAGFVPPSPPSNRISSGDFSANWVQIGKGIISGVSGLQSPYVRNSPHSNDTNPWKIPSVQAPKFKSHRLYSQGELKLDDDTEFPPLTSGYKFTGSYNFLSPRNVADREE